MRSASSTAARTSSRASSLAERLSAVKPGAEVGRVGIRREAFELRERDHVGDRLGLVPELALFPRHGIHLAPARASQAWISQPR